MKTLRARLAAFLVGFGFVASGVVVAATFNLFQPAAGILKGNPSTYVTTAAASSDVISLWSGTCNASTFLKGDGSCGAALSGTVPVGNGGTGATTLSGVLKGNGTSPVTSAASSDVISLWTGTCNASTFLRADGSCVAPAGGVTSVGLTMPSGFSVAGSPVTSSGTLAVTTTLNGVLAGNGSGFTTATAANVYGLWSGTCNSSSFLRGDGTCAAAGGTPAGSNGEVQYNSGGAFGAEAAFTYDPSLEVLSVAGGIEVETGGTIQIGNVNVCLANGTNCPAAGGTSLPIRSISTTDNTLSTDCGKAIVFTGAGSQTFTLDADPAVNCVLTFINNGSASVSLAASGTLTWFNGSGTNNTGTRTIMVGGVVTATVLSSAGSWQIWGAGISF